MSKTTFTNAEMLLAGATPVALTLLLSLASAPKNPGLFALCLVGALMLELRSVQPGSYGALSCGAAVYLSAMAVEPVGPGATALIFAGAIGVRTLLSTHNWRDQMRSAMADLWPLCLAGLVAEIVLGRQPELSLRLLGLGLTFIIFDGMTTRLFFGDDLEWGQVRRRFALANVLGSISMAYLLTGPLPLSAMFLFPLFIIVQHGGYGLVLQLREETLKEVTEQLKTSQQRLQSSVQTGRQLSQKVKFEETERKLVEGLSLFFSSSPSVEDVLQNITGALRKLEAIESFLIFAVQDARMLPVRWSESFDSRVQEMPKLGIAEPLLWESLRDNELCQLDSKPEMRKASELVKRCGNGLVVPLPEFGVLYLVMRAEFSEHQLTLVMTIASQISLGLRSARYRASLVSALAERTEALKLAHTSQAQLVQSGKMAALGQLAAGVAHEINSPLATILLQMHIARTRLDSGDLQKVSRSFEVVKLATNQAQKIIERLLKFSHPAGNERIEVSLETVVLETIELLAESFRLSGVSLDVGGLCGLTVLGDPGELQQVFTNLLLNAKDAALTNLPQRPALVSISAQSLANQVCLRIADSGPGIEKELMERIFEPFFTTKEIGAGTGLGLSISYGIIRSHGGQLEAENAMDGGGAIFTVTLPQSPSPANAAASG